ncbi:type II secretion system F family protein [Syntrophus aciditrophicus]|uniref:Flp pilus assembly protein n=1 Tax=Syntrophus aciditrophicus (strain SB) TaxID=56780 RepID=Q2LSW0_SYNAS|nr:type II secretion system F family protein [Syntrophus aciditrophicus]ABC77166.1 flp pilus assembly protein [Syntrophus aciditrophicus SB]OPY16731.1 MAG: Bacterial type II secretion system protein F domain protein [Syntrophus sp. PtaB.Bin075]
MNTLILISVMIFGATILFLTGLYLYIRYVREHAQLLDKIEKGSSIPSMDLDSGSDVSPARQLRALFVRITGRLGELVKPKKEDEVANFQKPLARIGYRGAHATLFFFGIKVLLAVLLPALFLMAKLLAGIAVNPLAVMIITLALALVGFYLPNLWLRLKIGARKEKIMEGFPDALDLMVICVEAGMGLDQAINRVGEEMKLSCPPISDEFRTLNMEMRMGKSRREALRNMANRTELDDVTSLVTLLIQTDQFGTSIGQALRVHSDSMRVQRRQRAEEKAAKLPLKLLFPLIFFIFPSLFVVIMGPAMIQVFHALSSR